MLVAEIRRVTGEARQQLPDAPPGTASELWMQIAEAGPTLRMALESNEAKMIDDVRRGLLHAGGLAASHLHALLAAPGLGTN